MAENIDKIAGSLGAETVGPASDTGGASGAAKVVHEAVAPAKRALEVKFREAMESGPATPMTPDDWAELERTVWERHRRADEADEPEA
jgi:hypothetical protein